VAVLTQLIPLALVVAWSPLKIIPAFLLVISSPRPKVASTAFLVASLTTLALCTAIFVIEVPSLLNRLGHKQIGWGPEARIGLGAALLAIGVYVGVKRRGNFGAPNWVSKLTRITPRAAAVLGVMLTVANLKVMVMNAAAGSAIGTAALGVWKTGAAIGIYTAVAGSTLIIPVVGYLLAAERVDRWSVPLRRWLDRHQAAMATIGSILLGFTLMLSGLCGV
jgi:Sap, sulfolipid-1-addressing protein